MSTSQQRAHAKALWANLLIHVILDAQEAASVAIAVNAKPSEADKITDALADARAVSRFRSKLKSLVDAADREGDGE